MMERVAVIADVHGNTWALDAVLADIEHRGADLTLNLGDAAWGPLDPAGSVDRLRQPFILSIAGNQDRVLQEAPSEPSATDRYVTGQLGPGRLQWLAGLPSTLDLRELFLCHGTPEQDDVYLLETVTPHGAALAGGRTIRSRLGDLAHPVILCGHSHVPRAVALPSDQLIVSPGSVGLPAFTDQLPYPHAMEAGSPHARYALLTRVSTGWAVELVAVPYPWQEAAAAARQQGREDWARWLETGRAS
jgi:predicted phosphodiesterase